MITKREYDVVDYNPEWPAQYQKEAAVVGKVFEDFAETIQHVGSTSIPGTPGKPQIDIVVLVPDIPTVDTFNAAMEAEGFTVYGDAFNLGARLFSRVEGNRKVTNVHVHTPDQPKGRRIILLRNYLRAHSNRAKEYGALKKSLKQQFPDDYDSYFAGKTDFLDQVFEEAVVFAKEQNTFDSPWLA